MRVWIAGWDISADRYQRIQASFLSQGGATFKRGKGPMAMDLPFPTWLCRPANKTTWGGTGDQASHFGGRVDAGGDCSAGTVWRDRHGVEPERPSGPGLYGAKRHLCSATPANQSEQHANRQLQHSWQRQPVHRRRRHADAALLSHITRGDHPHANLVAVRLSALEASPP